MTYMELWLAGVTITVFLLLLLVVHISNTQTKIINEIRSGGNFPPKKWIVFDITAFVLDTLLKVFMLPLKLLLRIIKEIKNAKK